MDNSGAYIATGIAVGTAMAAASRADVEEAENKRKRRLHMGSDQILLKIKADNMIILEEIAKLHEDFRVSNNKLTLWVNGFIWSREEEVEYIRVSNKYDTLGYNTVLIKVYDEDGNRNLDDDDLDELIQHLRTRFKGYFIE